MMYGYGRFTKSGRRAKRALMLLAVGAPLLGLLAHAMPVILFVYGLLASWWPFLLGSLIVLAFIGPEVQRLRYYQESPVVMVRTRRPDSGQGNDSLL